jgi:hypothetical protein
LNDPPPDRSALAQQKLEYGLCRRELMVAGDLDDSTSTYMAFAAWIGGDLSLGEDDVHQQKSVN